MKFCATGSKRLTGDTHGHRVGVFDEGTMAKIGPEVTEDEELGWIGCQAEAEGPIVVDGIVWLMVVVGDWFGRTGT